MFVIRNSNVELFKNSNGDRNKVTIISSKLEDQTYETLMHIGRGQMFSDPATNALKYELNKSISLYLWL